MLVKGGPDVIVKGATSIFMSNSFKEELELHFHILSFSRREYFEKRINYPYQLIDVYINALDPNTWI